MESLKEVSRCQTSHAALEAIVGTQVPHKGDRILRAKAVQTKCGFGNTKHYDLLKSGNFPAPIRIGGGRAIGWRESDVDLWIATRPVVDYRRPSPSRDAA